MAFILSIGTSLPAYNVNQEKAAEFARYMFQHSLRILTGCYPPLKTGKSIRDSLLSRLNGIKRGTALKKKSNIHRRNT